MKKLRCAIVGCGGIAQRHGQVLHDLKSAQLIACADIRPERTQALREKYCEPGARAYPSLEELLDHEEIDVLHICTPHYLHVPMAQTAVRRGVHVFMEKPPVIDPSQWEALQSLSGQVRIGVCFQNRYNPSVSFCRKLLAEGKAGKILGARAFVTWRREAPYYIESGWRGFLDTEGGGVLINQAVHTLDLLTQFLGQGEVLGASLANRHLQGVIEVEDTLEATLDFSGVRALFYATTAYCQDAPVLVELACEHAVLRIEGEEVTVRWEDGSLYRHDFSQEEKIDGKGYWGNSHQRCIGAFYQAVLSGGPFPNDIPGIADTAELMLAVYAAARGESLKD